MMLLRSPQHWSSALVMLAAAAAWAQPANDSPCAAIDIGVNSTQTFSTAGATASTVSNDCIPGLLDVWFRAPVTDALSITLAGTGFPSLIRPVISVYEASSLDVGGGCLTLNSSVPVACSELTSQNTAIIHVNRPLRGVSSAVYFIRVASSAAGSTGNATLTLSTDTTFATSTYQGELRENGTPVNGDFDVQLSIFDAPTGGTMFGSTVTSAVPVTDGRFTCTFKLSPTAMSGQEVYVDARVRPSGGGSFTSLLPRQRVLATPHALIASEAQNAHHVPWSGLIGIPSAFADGVDNITPLGNAGGGVSASAARDDHQHNALVATIGGGAPTLQVDGSGNVGIGTTTPAARLHVRSGGTGTTTSTSASAVFERAGTNYVQIIAPDANERGVSFGSPLSSFAGGIYYTNAGGMNFRTGTNDTHMVIDATGLIGMGRTPTANKLEVNGNASKSAAGSWLANSDARIKQDIRPVSDALATLDRVHLVSFSYTPDYRATHQGLDDRRYLNVIAQQFATVFPDWVRSSGEKLPDGSGILQVDTYPLTIYSAAAVQELHAKVKSLEDRVASQERQLAAQEARLRKLEAATRAPAAASGGR